MLKNKKSKKSSSSRHFSLTGRTLYITAISVALVIGLYFLSGYAFTKYTKYEQGADLAYAIQSRDLLVRAAPTTTAPVDFKTGDIYFPDARLYLPKNADYSSLIYSYYQGGSEQYELHVTSRGAIDDSTRQMYNATKFEDVWSSVPTFQACANGVTIVYDKLDDATPVKAIALNNGKTVYLYTQLYGSKACPSLSHVVDALSNLKSY